ncbi:MAG TPA: hypothetical protein VL283_02770 [Candidatus Baltobacteraceae bacterium]|nr:hypothetical protein [Candidatus Baltobacteraceae bacterium]
MNLRETLRRMDPTRQAIWLVLIWLLLASVLWVWWDERSLPDLRGSWASAGCEEVKSAGGVSRVKRSMEVDETQWRLTVDFYGEEGCTNELFSVETEGPYDLGPKSMGLRGATTVRFDLDKVTLTPRAAETADAFDAAGCAAGGWKVGEGQEVSQLGCLGIFPTRSTCPTEYDVVKIAGDALYLGDRSRGLCTPERYPARFAPAPLLRVDDAS